jgi:hypothetical protein
MALNSFNMDPKLILFGPFWVWPHKYFELAPFLITLAPFKKIDPLKINGPLIL